MDCYDLDKKGKYKCDRCSKFIVKAALGCEKCHEHYCFEIDVNQKLSCAERKMKMALTCYKKHPMVRSVKEGNKGKPFKCIGCMNKFKD